MQQTTTFSLASLVLGLSLILPGAALIPVSCLCPEEAEIDLGGRKLAGGLALRF